MTDFFVIGTGSNDRQLKAIGRKIEDELRDEGYRRYGHEGYTDATWVLIDYSDVVVHLFNPDSRVYYDLEILWGDAPKVPWKPKTEK